MAMTSNRTFMYGYFSRAINLLALMGMQHEPDIAIEILREFGATELVGRLFHKGATGTWQLMTLAGIGNYEWYKDFAGGKSQQLIVRGSDPWDVLFFRPESDETGPYVAVGLRLSLRSKS